MYLKSLELVGFKSFADRTKLEFVPGMSAIVGPNGCGKSNVADAVRWVLGEQSAKILRGARMEDCIFGGTDKRKPLGMAEVSLTLTDCEQALGTDFNEITVSRRVFRSGEGQYFINKTPCRLRDIQRLFMDTGIGTSSYSLMEQGRIDLILSSRPEDRREVFEEASGITKYKADKREAIRKLDQTEANLLRLADIIKEVRRQIISLQRQAGKAARYKKHQDELRRLDIFLTREKLQAIDQGLREDEHNLGAAREEIGAVQQNIARQEQIVTGMRERMARAEDETGNEQQALLDLGTRRDRARQAIETNRRRMHEMQEQHARDTKDVSEAAAEMQRTRDELDESEKLLAAAETEFAAAEAELRQRADKSAAHENAMRENKQAADRLLNESMDLENRLAHIQNEIHKLENEDRNTIVRRERCAAERENLRQILAAHEKRSGEIEADRSRLQAERDTAAGQLDEIQSRLNDNQREMRATQQTAAELRAAAAAAAARMDMLEKNLRARTGLSNSTRLLLENESGPGAELRDHVIGTLAGRLETEPEFRAALEAALRTVLEAVVVRDMPGALECLRRLEPQDGDSLQLLTAAAAETRAAGAVAQLPGAVNLRAQVRAPVEMEALLDRLLAGVMVIDGPEALPDAMPPGLICVTRAGLLVGGDGRIEHVRGGARSDNPLAQKHMLDDQRAQLADREAALAECARDTERRQSMQNEFEQALGQLREALAGRQQALAHCEGEMHVVSKQAEQARQNLETVAWEFQQLSKQQDSTVTRQKLAAETEDIRERRRQIRTEVEKLRAMEMEQEKIQRRLTAGVTEAQVFFAKQQEARVHINARRQPLLERLKTLENLIGERAERRTACNTEIERARAAMESAAAELPQLEAELERHTTHLEKIQTLREEMQSTVDGAGQALQRLRDQIEDLRRRESELNGRCIEQRMQRQYTLERVTGEYRIAPDAIQLEPAPEWSDGQCPGLEAVETMVAELRAKIESMGSVNTGAIEEYREQEERYAFLNSQQDDLLKSKQQLLEMIKQINRTTTEMFSKTFTAINENFQTIFKQLFGGGTAKLMLSDDEDILECGIEIIARPPGKKLQSVSLLSGGERTMTAVALLFAIYMVKPSPFCLLDELDAALDESNINRFIKVLQGFVRQSQFIVITHNRATISAADVLYGVTMEETGVSNIVSMRFVEDQAPPPVAADETAAASAALTSQTTEP